MLPIAAIILGLTLNSNLYASMEDHEKVQKDYVKEPFIVINSDDLYGENLLKELCKNTKI